MVYLEIFDIVSIIFLCDRLINFLDKITHNSGWNRSKYYLIHFVINIIIVITCFRDFLETWNNPINALEMKPPKTYDQHSLIPAISVVLCHLYHILCFRPLSMVDWQHHILMIGICIPASLIFSNGPFLNFIMFFASGLPGGLDYLMLSLVRLGWMNKLNEKMINTYLNIYLRGPGMVISSFLIYQSCIYSLDCNRVISTVMALIVFWNGQYFTHRVVRNYYRLTP